MNGQARPVAVTAGGVEFRYIVITETTGKDISGDTCVACIAPYGTVPDDEDFAAPDSVVFSDANSVVTIGVLVSSTNATAGQSYKVWGKPIDSPEIVPIAAPDSFPVI